MNATANRPRSGRAMRARTRAARAFTLVELLVVIGIIATLIAILMPAIGAARTQGLNAATRHGIRSVEAGIEMFRNDHNRIPRSGMTGNGNPAAVDANRPDYMDPTGATTLGPGFAMANPGSYMTGAHWLVYELAGPDRLGYAEPRNIVNPTTTGIDVNDLPGTRQGPYIATEDANLVPDEDPNTPGTGTPNPELHMMVRDGAGDWGDIPAGDRRVTGLYLLRDSFDSPILYYAANRGAHRNVGNGVHDIYNIQDNALFTGLFSSTTPPAYLDIDGPALPLGANEQDSGGVTFVEAEEQDPWPNPLGLFGPAPIPPAPGTNQIIDDALIPPTPWVGSWAWYLQDPRIGTGANGTNARPHKADSFILISPGADGVYGTRDDVANFEMRK